MIHYLVPLHRQNCHRNKSLFVPPGRSARWWASCMPSSSSPCSWQCHRRCTLAWRMSSRARASSGNWNRRACSPCIMACEHRCPCSPHTSFSEEFSAFSIGWHNGRKHHALRGQKHHMKNNSGRTTSVWMATAPEIPTEGKFAENIRAKCMRYRRRDCGDDDGILAECAKGKRSSSSKTVK
jgi:hypothetical protein